MLFFDIETDGLLDSLTKIHCISIYDSEKKQFSRYDPENFPIYVGVQKLAQADAICGHNIIDFDIAAIKKLYPTWRNQGRVVDTLVLARLLFSEVIKGGDFGRYQKGRLPGKLIGSHSLEAYGYRLGVFKGDYGKTTDWQRWTPEMSEYCEQDVRVTIRLFEKIMSKNPTRQSWNLEHNVRHIISRQEHHGFTFDIKAAEQLYVELVAKREEILRELHNTIPPFYKAKGKLFTPKRDNKRYGYVQGCPVQKIERVEFSPTSSQHVYVYLRRKYGWEPTKFTKKSQMPEQFRYLFADYYRQLGLESYPEPEINETVLEGLDWPEVKPLKEAMTLAKRIGQIGDGKQAWLKHYNEKTGRIHGAVNSCGAVTGRMTHFNPNVAQVPAGYSPYGHECRSLWIVPPGYRLVGCDASGLEARCLAHFMARWDGGRFVEIILEGSKEEGTDIHSLNAKVLGLSRDDAKTWFYGWMYGAGDQKLGAIAKRDKAYGAKMRAEFEKAYPALAKLVNAVKTKAEQQGWIKGLDGRKLWIRSSHAALNTLLQSAGALVMKQALIFTDDRAQERGWKHTGIDPKHYDYEFVANIHDETQSEVRKEIAPEYGEIAAQAIRDAGDYFNFRCPLDADYEVGMSWSETH